MQHIYYGIEFLKQQWLDKLKENNHVVPYIKNF